MGNCQCFSRNKEIFVLSNGDLLTNHLQDDLDRMLEKVDFKPN